MLNWKWGCKANSPWPRPAAFKTASAASPQPCAIAFKSKWIFLWHLAQRHLPVPFPVSASYSPGVWSRSIFSPRTVILYSLQLMLCRLNVSTCSLGLFPEPESTRSCWPEAWLCVNWREGLPGRLAKTRSTQRVRLVQLLVSVFILPIIKVSLWPTRLPHPWLIADLLY